MKKILAFLFAVSLFYFVGAQSVLASSNFNVEVRTYLDGSNMNQAASGLVDQARGSKVQFNASGISSEYEFAFYAVNDIVRDDLPQNYEFVVRSNMKITAFFRPNGSITPANARHVVIFADNNGKIIDGGVQYVADGGDASAPSVLPTKPNAEHADPKWFTPQGESSLLNITSSRVYLLQYVSTDGNSYAVNVTGGSVVEEAPYNYNEVVTLQPDAAPAEQVFSHWEDAEGNVLSTKANYKFTVMGNASVQAVFAATPEFNSAVVNMSDALSIRSGYVTYKGQFDLPAGFTLVEYGFIFSRSSDVLTLDSLGATIVPSNVHNGQTGEFLRSFPNDTFNSIRAYLIVKDASKQEVVVYSNNYFRSVSTLGESGSYLASFDTESKSSYTLGTVTVNGISWTLDDALIAADTNRIGAQSVRTRGTIYTNSGFANISTISFKGAKYGTDADNSIQLFLSKDGSTWTDVSDGLDLTAVTSTTLVDYVFTLSNSVNFSNSSLVAGDVLKIKITVGVLGQRINLDEIMINYGAYTGPIHEVITVSESTNSEFIAEGSPVSNPANKTGHTFIGWYLDSGFVNSYNNSGVIESITLYAKYDPNSYIVTFNYNGADGGEQTPSITAVYNNQIELPIPTKTGYDFGGWESSTGLTQYSSPYTIEASNRTMYAKWIINDLGKATADANALSLPLNINDNTPLSLSTTGSNGSSISWSSDTPSIIDNNGSIVLPVDNPVLVTLTATINSNGQIVTRDFNITVNPESNSPDPVVLRQNDFGTTNSTIAYTTLNTLAVSHGTLDPQPSSSSNWTIFGGNFNNTSWDYVRMGGKATGTLANLSVYMKTNFSYSGTITSVIVNIVNLDSATGNEVIYLQSSLDGTNWSTVTNQTITSTGNLTFSGLNLSNVYLRFVFERASTGSNAGTDIKSITVYGNP